MKNYKENFSDYLPGYKGNVNSSIHSRSFLDSPNNNLYNSTYCNLLPDTNNGFIQKRNFDFDGDIQLLDDFFYDPNQSNENDCLQECKKNKYCAAYKFDSTSETNKCKLINNYPNKLKQSNNSNIGYRVNKNNLKKYASMKKVFEKSIVSNKFLNKGTKIKINDLNFKKPGNGIRADKYKDILGKVLKKNIKINHKFKYSDFH